MRLSKTTNHAIKILIHCAKSKGELVKVAEISDELEITQQNVFKIVHMLSRAGFVSAVRGRNGGVRLASGPAEIKVGQVVRAIEESATAAQHPVGRGGADFETMVDSALSAFIDVLDGHSIADMAALSKPSRKTAKNVRSKKPVRRPRTISELGKEPARR